MLNKKIKSEVAGFLLGYLGKWLSKVTMLKILNGSDCLILSPHRYLKEQALFSSIILGSYFVVKVNVETQYICKVFVDETLCSNYALIGNMVTQTLCKSERSISNFSLSERCEKVILTKNLKVTLIFRSVGDIRKWKGNFRKVGLIQQIMSGFIFKEGFYLTIRYQPIAKQNGLDCIYIKETEVKNQFCKINSSTRIEIAELFLFDHIIQHICLDKYFIPGLDAEICTAMSVIDSAFKDSKRLWKGILLWGPSGCGREILPLEIAKRKCMYLMEVKCDLISSSYVGESETKLKEIVQNAKEYSQIHPVVLFVENVESICPKWTSASMHRRRIASQLLSGIDSIQLEDRVFVIGSSEYPGAIEPLLRRHGRLDKEIYIGMPTIEARYALLEYFMEQLSLNKAIELDLKEVAEKLVGYNRNDIERLVGTASLEEKTDCICNEDFLKAMHTVGPSLRKSDNLGIVDYVKTQWNEVGGLERAKVAIKKAVEWPLKYPEAFARFGIPKPKGILLYGPPGCGKSLLVRAAATECSASFLSVKASEIFSCFVGDSEKLIASLFSKARLMAPCILFLDELDSIVGSRESVGNLQSIQQGIISTLLQEVDGITATSASMCNKELDGISNSDNDNKTKIQFNVVPTEGVILIGATNQPDKIDSALLRPGRLDTHVYVPPPDFLARIDILKMATKVMPLNNVDVEKIAKVTNGYSGADLKLLCKEASYKCYKPSYFLLNDMEKSSKQPESPADDVFPFSLDENVQAPEISFDMGSLIEKVQQELKKKFPHDLASTEKKNCKRGFEEQNEKQVSKEKKKCKLESQQVMPFDNLVFDLSAYEGMNDLKPPKKSEENKLRNHHSGFYHQISSATANRVH